MDPDMVRQQAEAELEQRARPPVKAQDVPLKDVPAVETVLAAVAEPAAAPPPATIQAPPAAQAMPVRAPRWRVKLQALCSGSTLAGIAALAAAAWGARYGLSADGQIWLGGGGAALTAAVYAVMLSVSGGGFTPPGNGG
jgi:hypothetical protein